MGEVMVAERHGFQRVYDLRERIVPSWVDTSTPTQEEMDQLRRYWQELQGVVTPRATGQEGP